MKKLTITVEDAVYKGLRKNIGAGRISRFLNDLARPHVVGEDLTAAYHDMALDRKREADALEWSDSLIGDSRA